MAQAFAHNGDFVFNALDNLAGSEDLISVRGRATFTRPFVRGGQAARQCRVALPRQGAGARGAAQRDGEKLTELESKRDDKSSLILTPEQERALQRFQDEKVRIRKELRAVRLGLDQDIKGLGTRLKMINIVLVPLLFALVATGVVFWRRRAPPSRSPKREAGA